VCYFPAVPGFQDATQGYVLHSINISFQHLFILLTSTDRYICYFPCHFQCYFPAVSGFQDAIRGYVMHSISISFQRVSMRVLADWLKLEGAALQQLLAEKVGATFDLG
jgi:hypothetical protein